MSAQSSQLTTTSFFFFKALLPARSVAVTLTLCVPSLSFGRNFPAHALAFLRSTLHLNVAGSLDFNFRFALPLRPVVLIRLFPLIFSSGFRVSTVKLRLTAGRGVSGLVGRGDRDRVGSVGERGADGER